MCCRHRLCYGNVRTYSPEYARLELQHPCDMHFLNAYAQEKQFNCLILQVRAVRFDESPSKRRYINLLLPLQNYDCNSEFTSDLITLSFLRESIYAIQSYCVFV